MYIQTMSTINTNLFDSSISEMSTINTNLLDSSIPEIGKTNIHYLVMNSRTRSLLAAGNVDRLTYMGEYENYSKYREIPILIYEGLTDGNIAIL